MHKLLALVSFFLIIMLSRAQDDTEYGNHKMKETITVISIDSGYTSHTEYSGVTDEKGGLGVIAFSSMKPVSNVKLGKYKKSGKLKNIRRLNIEDLAISTTFIGDDTLYVFDLPVDHKYKYEYDQTCNELMLLSSFVFDYKNADTLEYEIIVPKGLVLIYETVNTDSLLFFKDEKIEHPEHTNYRFTAITGDLDDDLKKKSRFTKPKNIVRGLKFIVVPEEYTNRPFAYLNHWYTDKVNNIEKCNEETLRVFDKEVGNLSDRDSIIDRVFNLVQDKIRYIDIEIGIGGFVPHDPNYILSNKQGDCKDMAFLLYNALNYFGIEAYLAISGTMSHVFEMDFPSLSSGNHMICVTKDKNGNYLFLDATEGTGYFKNPSLFTQGTNVFVINDGEEGNLIKVPVIRSKENTISIVYDIFELDNSFEGFYSFTFSKLHAVGIKKWYHHNTMITFKRKIVEYLEHISPKIDYRNVEVDSYGDSIVISGEMKLSKSVMTQVGNKVYLLMDFLPFPHLLFKDITDEITHINYTTYNTLFELTLHTKDQPRELYTKDISLKDEMLSFDFSSSIENDNLIIQYQYIYDDVIIDKNNVARFNDFDLKIKDTFKKAIVFSKNNQ
jgi:hypothetical protein